MQTNEIPIYEVLTFGGPRVGKTTLLASMLQDSIRAILHDRLALKITPDEKGEAALNKTARALRIGYEMEGEQTSFEQVLPTRRPVDYRFNVGRSGQPARVALHFNDTLGEHTVNMDPILRETFSRSRAAILVIDSVELMEGNKYKIPADVRRNVPENARDLVRAWLEVTATPQGTLLLCVVPMKCETWVRERANHDAAAGATKLLNAFRREYGDLLSTIDTPDTRDRVAVVMCPVQSAGNLEFLDFEPASAEIYPTPRFRKIVGDEVGRQPDVGFAPADADQPLRHLLAWVLIDELEARRRQNESGTSENIRDVAKLFDWLLETRNAERYDFVRATLLDLFGRDRDLARAVSSFVLGTKTKFPFEIIQGNNIISRRSAVWDRINSLLAMF